MWVLGIDTSCDDTGVGLVCDGQVVANLVASQTLLHQRFGGVVPELASREHTQVIDGLVQQALQQAQLSPQNLDLIAATQGPGLAGALLVGLTYARGLAWALGKPWWAVHHLEGHLYGALAHAPQVRPPFLALLASGGHTHLFLVSEWGQYQKLGATLDDAAGEAFDKVARLLQLGYPGGPLIEQLAQQGDPRAVPFGLPLQHQEGLNFSFSGLKTAAARFVQQGYAAADLAASFQRVVVEHLVGVVARAARRYGTGQLVMAGGVAANRLLRQHLDQLGLEVCFPAAGLVTDNGAMIALAAQHRFAGEPSSFATPVLPYFPLESLSEPERFSSFLP